MAYQTAVANKTAWVFLKGVNNGSPRNREAKNPPAKMTIMVESQQEIGCLRENGIDPGK